MDSKKIIEKLIKIAENQQKIIQKLAQALPPDSLPSSGTSFTPGKSPAPAAPPPPASFHPAEAGKRDAAAILGALPPATKPAVAVLEVHNNNVMVKFHPGKGTDQAFNSVLQTVQQLQNSNVLAGKNYQVKEVA